jgi:hypothetical protein
MRREPIGELGGCASDDGANSGCLPRRQGPGGRPFGVLLPGPPTRVGAGLGDLLRVTAAAPYAVSSRGDTAAPTSAPLAPHAGLPPAPSPERAERLRPAASSFAGKRRRNSSSSAFASGQITGWKRPTFANTPSVTVAAGPVPPGRTPASRRPSCGATT